jgi:LDH2 family malate/lactate/ureidoglycolate dehydrogenase
LLGRCVEQAMNAGDSILLQVDAARSLGVAALQKIGFTAAEAEVITAGQIDAELCGYPALGLARILTISEHENFRKPRSAIRIEHETPVSARIDGGNYPGFYAVYRAMEVAIEKAQANRFAVVGARNCWMSGRSAYYVEKIARAGFACAHFACSGDQVAPLGGKKSVLGTNPMAFGLPGEPHPFVLDVATSATNNGDVILAGRLNQQLPEGVAIDPEGNPTRDPAAALAGSILTFGGEKFGHKGFGLSLMTQAMGLMAGPMLTNGRPADFGFLFIVFDPALLMPLPQFKQHLAALLDEIRATPRQPGVSEIRIPSERAFAQRERARATGFSMPRRIHDRLQSISNS